MTYEEWMEKKISRKDEHELPEFQSHEDARNFFKKKYGDKFQLVDSFMVDERKCFFYKLILDEESYLKGIREMNQNGFTASDDFLFSSQDIQIMSDGEVHIVH